MGRWLGHWGEMVWVEGQTTAVCMGRCKVPDEFGAEDDGGGHVVTVTTTMMMIPSRWKMIASDDARWMWLSALPETEEKSFTRCRRRN